MNYTDLSIDSLHEIVKFLPHTIAICFRGVRNDIDRRIYLNHMLTFDKIRYLHKCDYAMYTGDINRINIISVEYINKSMTRAFMYKIEARRITIVNKIKAYRCKRVNRFIISE